VRNGGEVVTLISLFCERCGGDVYERDHAYKCRPTEQAMSAGEVRPEAVALYDLANFLDDAGRYDHAATINVNTDALAARLATVEGALQAEHDKRIEHDAMCGNLRTIEGVQAKLAEALAQLSTTQAALEAAQRDAGRYRYLCSLSNADWNRFGRVPDNEVDAAIDAAISAGGEKGETT